MNFGVLSNRSFLVLWLGLLVSSVGDWINYVAMVALVYQQTHSATALAILRLFHIVPILIFAPFAGVFVDRWSRKAVLVISPLVSGLAVGVLTFFHPVGFVFGAYGVITVALMFFNPARSAVIPSIVSQSELMSANSLSQITVTSSMVVGGVAGGIVVSALGSGAAFLLDAISFLVIAGLISTVRVADSRVPARLGSLRAELLEGLSYLQSRVEVANVVVAGAIFVFAQASVFTLGIVFVRTTLHGGSAQYGLILAGMGVGSLIAAAWMTVRAPRWREDVAFAASGIGVGIAVAAMGLSRSVLMATVLYGVVGLAAMVNTVAAVTFIQRLVPDHMRGRIFAVAATFDHLGAFISTLGIGLGDGLLSAAGLITGSGALAAVTGLFSFFLAHRASSPRLTPSDRPGRVMRDG